MKADKEAKAAVRKDKRKHMDLEIQEIVESEEHRDYKGVWVAGRRLAGTGLGPKRRVYAPPDADPITTAEWDIFMADSFGAHQVTGEEPRACDGWTGQEMQSIELKKLKRNILRQKNNKTTVAGSVPSEVWKMCFKFCLAYVAALCRGPLDIMLKTAKPPQA